jgi:plastocyanin
MVTLCQKAVRRIGAMRAFRALPYAVAVLALTGVVACSSPAPETTPGGSVSAGTAVVRRLEVTIKGSTVTPAPAQVDLPVGDTLELVVTSDHDDEVHAHGFDQEVELKAGVPATLRLIAKEPGLYEVETHEPPLTLLTVAVR